MLHLRARSSVQRRHAHTLPDAVRQLTIDLIVSGTYLNIIKLLGKFEYSKVKINVREFKIAPAAHGLYLVRLQLGILMQPPSAMVARSSTISAWCSTSIGAMFSHCSL